MATSPGVGDKAPPFHLTDPKGNTVHLSDYAGRLLVLVFTRHPG